MTTDDMKLAEKCVMVCPQCQGEGEYPDGTDEDACSMQCTRCEGMGTVVDFAALRAITHAEGLRPYTRHDTSCKLYANTVEYDCTCGLTDALSAGSRASAQVEGEGAHLSHIIDRDRYIVAIGLGHIRKALDGHRWLLEGRGPYEWDDDKYRDEFAAWVMQVEQATGLLSKLAWDKGDCTEETPKVEAARNAARAYAQDASAGHRNMLPSDLGLPCPSCSALRAQPKTTEPTDALVDRVERAIKAAARGHHKPEAIMRDLKPHLAALRAPAQVEGRLITLWRKTGDQWLDWDYHISDHPDEVQRVVANIQKQGVLQLWTYHLGPIIPEHSK